MCVLVKTEPDIQDDFHWKGYGLRVSVSESLTETCKISVRALVSGKFKFPKGMKLSSAVYALSISEPLLKPVKLEIQHYAHVVVQEHTSYLHFAAASLRQDDLYYKFEVKKGGQFFVGKQYGCISLSESTLIAIVTSDQLLNEELVLESSSHLSLDYYQDEEVCLDARKLEHFVRNFLPSKLETDRFYACNCILPVLARSLHSYNKFEPLVFLWQEPIPQGFFQTFVSNLCSHKCFEVSLPQLGKIENCKAAISFKCSNNIGGDILLVETKFSINVYYSGRPEKCYSIREMIKMEVDAVITKKFQDMFEYGERLECHDCNPKECTKHYCFWEGNKYLRCICACNGFHQIDTERQLPWFKSEHEGKSVYILHLQS